MAVEGNVAQLTKKQDAAKKTRYQLHVSLIQVQDAVPKSTAQFIAWCEGAAGLATRLNPKG